MNIKSTKLLLIAVVGLAATAAATENLLLAAPVLAGGWIASRALLRVLNEKTQSVPAVTPATATRAGSKDLLTAWAEVATEARLEGTLNGTPKYVARLGDELPARAATMELLSGGSNASFVVNGATGVPMGPGGFFDFNGNPNGISDSSLSISSQAFKI